MQPSFSSPGMALALTQAEAAAARNEVPIGAVILSPDGAVLAAAHNEVEMRRDPTAHAELLAIQAACAALGSKCLDGYDLYVTLEPCAMCAQAIAFARLRRVYFGAFDPKGGGVEHGARVFHQPTCHHRPDVYGGIREADCAAVLRTFFQARR